MRFSKKRQIYTVAFYNVENLFDTVDNPLTADDQYTAKGERRWNKKKYLHKIRKLSSVIAQLGTNLSAHAPAIVGLVEVENSKVIQDLIRHKNLSKHDYGFVHYDSPDERGIDVALLYNRRFFEVLSSKTYELDLYDEDGNRDYTRDVLLVSGRLNGELIHVLVNHWPSRREGIEESKHKRIKAAKVVHEAIEDIKRHINDPNVIIMGDFNDDPTSESIQDNLLTDELFNPMNMLHRNGFGTLTFGGKWNLFDQIIFSKNFFDSGKSKHTFLHAEVFNQKWLKVHRGKLQGSPFRTYIGPWYKGGFSDHFPVYTYFEKDE
ncbi:endonuclease/exonuclease/phosphatase family protein [Tenacibaculum sp. IB213877]|uniref:endonuclease/exonuclease/phosphatase family protein n=1 Tax=Tenacibaculum sp. IB213877 TaxID=3097351 RepID=UPI002A5AF964|nr:endonuclease/exonuclease/phosphatase family protein [Tenacibaculum sp. IB213877]MDY0780538.1 endonuclease/exonuclease/phosphatase family protein [Tenacibaculum sp. IB213877]